MPLWRFTDETFGHVEDRQATSSDRLQVIVPGMPHGRQMIDHSRTPKRRLPSIEGMDRMKIGNEQGTTILQHPRKFLRSRSQIRNVPQREGTDQQIKLL